MSSSTPPNCHPAACAIQSCLTRNSSNDAKCAREILDLYLCCERMYLATGGSKEGVKGGESCPSLYVLKRNLKSRGRTYGDQSE